MPSLDSHYSYRPHGCWNKLANLVGGDYVNVGGSESVSLRVRGGVIVLHEQRVGNSSPHTRIRASYISLDDFTFSIHSKTPFHRFAKFFGMRHIEVGDSEFDDKFIIRANDASKIQALFANETIRQKLLAIHSIHLLFVGVTQAENPGISPVFGGRHEIVWARAGLVGYIDLLRYLFDVFAEILNQLCEIGSAKDDD